MINCGQTSLWLHNCEKKACFAGCAQTLLNATSPMDKIHPFNKSTVTLEPMMRFDIIWETKKPKPMHDDLKDNL